MGEKIIDVIDKHPVIAGTIYVGGCVVLSYAVYKGWARMIAKEVVRALI